MKYFGFCYLAGSKEKNLWCGSRQWLFDWLFDWLISIAIVSCFFLLVPFLVKLSWNSCKMFFFSPVLCSLFSKLFGTMFLWTSDCLVRTPYIIHSYHAFHLCLNWDWRTFFLGFSLVGIVRHQAMGARNGSLCPSEAGSRFDWLIDWLDSIPDWAFLAKPPYELFRPRRTASHTAIVLRNSNIYHKKEVTQSVKVHFPFICSIKTLRHACFPHSFSNFQLYYRECSNFSDLTHLFVITCLAFLRVPSRLACFLCWSTSLLALISSVLSLWYDFRMKFRCPHSIGAVGSGTYCNTCNTSANRSRARRFQTLTELPKRPTKLKSELIDVDLVRGACELPPFTFSVFVPLSIKLRCTSFHANTFFPKIKIIKNIIAWNLWNYNQTNWITFNHSEWLSDHLIDWLFKWLNAWLFDWWIDWLTDWLIDWLSLSTFSGSTFPKEKSQFAWTFFTRDSISRVLFLPIHDEWWIEQSTDLIYLILVVLYLLQVFCLATWVWSFATSATVEWISANETLTPLVLMFIVSEILTQAERHDNVDGAGHAFDSVADDGSVDFDPEDLASLSDRGSCRSSSPEDLRMERGLRFSFSGRVSVQFCHGLVDRLINCSIDRLIDCLIECSIDLLNPSRRQVKQEEKPIDAHPDQTAMEPMKSFTGKHVASTTSWVNISPRRNRRDFVLSARLSRAMRPVTLGCSEWVTLLGNQPRRERQLLGSDWRCRVPVWRASTMTSLIRRGKMTTWRVTCRIWNWAGGRRRPRRMTTTTYVISLSPSFKSKFEHVLIIWKQ